MIRNIWAVGRNYAEHAKELGNQIPTEPMIFLKAGSCASFSQEIQLPGWTTDVHHEIELALRFGEDLNFDEFGLALDLTERTVQGRLKANGQPWTLAKSFSQACPLSHFLKFESAKSLESLPLTLTINDQVRQNGTLSQMIFPIEKLRQFVVNHFPVCPGDLLLTGTPAGVGPIVRGDRLTARFGDLIQHSWLVV